MSRPNSHQRRAAKAADEVATLRAEVERLTAQLSEANAEREQARAALEVAYPHLIGDGKAALTFGILQLRDDRDEWQQRATTAEAKATQYERDWYDAKAEFGNAMAKAREAIRAAETKAQTAEAEAIRLRRDGGNLADEVAVLVRRHVIDSRSPAADALLDFREPPSSPRADRIAAAEAALATAREAADRLTREYEAEQTLTANLDQRLKEAFDDRDRVRAALRDLLNDYGIARARIPVRIMDAAHAALSPPVAAGVPGCTQTVLRNDSAAYEDVLTPVAGSAAEIARLNAMQLDAPTDGSAAEGAKHLGLKWQEAHRMVTGCLQGCANDREHEKVIAANGSERREGHCPKCWGEGYPECRCKVE